MAKTIHVTTNDPVSPQIKMEIKGLVKKIADVQPDYIRLAGRLGSKIEKKATVTPTADFPFRIKQLKTKKKGNIRTVHKADGKGYEITVTSVYPREGSFDDEIIIITDNPRLPELRIPVNAYVLPAEPGRK